MEVPEISVCASCRTSKAAPLKRKFLQKYMHDKTKPCVYSTVAYLTVPEGGIHGEKSFQCLARTKRNPARRRIVEERSQCTLISVVKVDPLGD